MEWEWVVTGRSCGRARVRRSTEELGWVGHKACACFGVGPRGHG